MDETDISLGNIIELQQIYKILEPHGNLLKVFEELLVMKNQEVASYVTLFETEDSEDSDDSEYELEEHKYNND